MRSVFSYQVLRLLRDKILLLWTLGLPIALSLLFMMMFSGLEEGYAVDPMRVGIVHDDAYAAEAGLDGALAAVSAADAEPRLLDPVAYDTAEQAAAAVQEGETVGYIAVEDGGPALHLTPACNDLATTPVLRAALDATCKAVMSSPGWSLRAPIPRRRPQRCSSGTSSPRSCR
ncbi:ABC transporter permease [Actinomyces ruminis]|uniref:ABC transporter permease n=1 Tax=Actinomyces ruminis TaxID=1937003 RepID=UPI00211DE73E|nr:ABC transporter permease [Actinomyces ruminis]